MKSVSDIIKRLELQPHPEGGYFKETYRSKGLINSENLEEAYSGDRNYSTAIYFLLTSDSFSAFHRINQDEVWHFYDGSPIRLYMISPEGELSSQLIGLNLEQGELPQFVVPGGHWFSAEVLNSESYSLVGCTVAPGFSFEDFQMIPRHELIEMFPKHKEIITKMTHS